VEFAEQPVVILGVEDAGELLTLQRAAYVTEAQAHDDPHLPPLLETLDEVRADLRSDATTVLGIRDRDRLVATVRVRHDPVDRSTAEIARLAVAPDRQGEGLGTRLLVAAEQHVRPEATVLTLFTGEHSHGNLRLYERQGYTETHRSPAGTHQLVHMRKRVG
jgi:ribosomal protein S18 acetylase RimI-like enzyme